MSVSSERYDIGYQPTYESISRGFKKGYSTRVYLVGDRPDYKNISTVEKKDLAIESLCNLIIDILNEFEDENVHDRKVKDVIIGKTFVDRRQTRGSRDISPTEPTTWRVGGIPSRWGTKYKGLGYDAMIVFECFVESDVPIVLREVFGFDQQSMCLMFENYIIKAMKEMKPARDSVLKRVKIVNDDDGGGGRDGAHDGAVLYVAIKLSQPTLIEEDEQAGSGTESEEDS